MKLYLYITSIAIILLSMLSIPTDLNGQQNDKFISDLISKMTLEEKIGQMQQVNGQYGHISEDYKQQIIDGKIGSILNEVNVETRNKLQKFAVEESRLGIPLIFGRDVIHGFKTVFPIPLGQACTWNPELVKEGARISALEAWSSGVDWTFAPMIDISRDARWGRIAESLGEDPYLASIFASAMVEGFQGDDLKDEGSILACAKHFAGYGASEGGRDYNTTMIPEGELRDVYLKPFKAAKDAGVGSFMSGFNELNGVPATGNEFLLKQILREEWGFEGFVVSDWASIYEMIGHGFASDEKHAASKAVKVGVDMEMATTAYQDHLQTLIDEGKVDENLIDESVYRILKAKKDLGLFDNPYVPQEKQYQFAKKEYLESALESATQSMVLLKNEDGVLPLKAKDQKIAVIGPMADQKYEQLGTWVFDGDENLSVTPLEAFRQKYGEENILFAPGLSYSRDRSKEGFKQAVKVALESDVIVLCMGEESIISGEAHCLTEIDLKGSQNELIQMITQLDKPVILTIIAGRPLGIGDIADMSDAVIYSFHPGTMGGQALANLISGESVFSGKLPVTFPKNAGQIPFYYNRKNTGRPSNAREWTPLYDIAIRTPQTSLGNSSHYLDAGFEPLYPFGYGLSYTQFEYNDLQIKSNEIEMGADLELSVSLKNSGDVDGVEIVQVYVRDLVADVTRPIKELKAFRRVALKAGESKVISFSINTDEFAFYNQKMEKVVEAGKFDLWVGGSSESNLKSSFIVK